MDEVATQGQDQPEKAMPREAPNVDEGRRAKVKALQDMVRDDRKHWEYAFKRMQQWRAFARGLQWPGDAKEDLSDPDRRYVANVTMRHLKQRTAQIYAKNPTYIWRRSKRMTRQAWDGTSKQLLMAQEMVLTGRDLTGRAQMILQDAAQSKSEGEVHSKIGDTLTALYEYFMREQTPPLKKMAKKQVLTSLTCGVAYFKQRFQRVTDYEPHVSAAIADQMAALAKMERLAADLADDEFDQHSAEMEELRAMVAALEQQPQVVLREGLAIDYPDSTNIIPDKNMTYLPGFVGCGHVTEQFCLTVDQIKEFYGVDVSTSYTKYSDNEIMPGKGGGDSEQERDTARVWEVWDKSANLVYTICDGYEDYLVEPHAPVTYTERFYPWFVYAPNAVDDPDDPFPPSDVELMMPMQMEINRAGEALRDHRWAARPGWVSGSNIPEDDVMKIERRKAHAITVLKSLAADEDVRRKFQAFPVSPIDPNLYNTGPAFNDILRSVGTQEANLGGTSGSTATESAIAESSRQSTLGSAIDEFDDLLTEMARAGGQILLQEMDAAQVQRIVGRGAVWPEQSREEVAAEIHLEVEAGSSGRRNQAQDVQMRERIYPLLFQIPGLKHEKMAKDLLHVMDDNVHYEDWVDMDAMSIMAFNGAQQATANRGAPMEGEGEGNNGEGGGDNAPAPPEPGPAGMARPGQDGTGASPVTPTMQRFGAA